MSRVRVGGTWRDIAMPHARVGGTWRAAKSVYNKVAGKWYSSFLQGGVNDFGFADYDFASKFDLDVEVAALQPDGKILVGGTFTGYSGVLRRRFARLNANGTLDTAFSNNLPTDPGIAQRGIYATVVQPDGKILVGGALNSWSGVAGGIVRLNSDGTKDTAFTTNNGTGANAPTSAGIILSIALQPDGKILLGSFGMTSWNGVTVGRVVRLNADGTRDTTFTTNNGTGANSGVYDIKIQPDGKIILAGNFTTWNGVTVNRIVRLNPDGTRDTAFTTNTGTGATGTIENINLQSDGKILLSFAITAWNGTTVGRVVRLNSDGTFDTTFNTNIGTGANAQISAAEIQSDGKIILGGIFTTWNDTAVGYIVRLNSDGTRDTTFTTNTGTGAGGVGAGEITTILVQSNNQILVVGNFVIFNNKQVNRIVRLNIDGTFANDSALGIESKSFNNSVLKINSTINNKILVGGNFTTFGAEAANAFISLNYDGTRDTAFTTNTGTGPNTTVNTIAVQPNGQILVGGAFTAWNGAGVGRFVRLNSDGTRDTTFTTNNATGADSVVYDIKIQPDGKIILAGSFTSCSGVAINRIARLNSDGTFDFPFSDNVITGANNTVNAIAVQPDGKIILGGVFTTWEGGTVNRIVRLDTDGVQDTTFTTNTGTGANGIVNTIAVQPNGQILVGGAFTTWNGASVGRVVRLNADGTRDTTFTTSPSNTVNTIAVQPNGQIIVGGLFNAWSGVTVNYIVRLNSDGTRDTAFTTNTGTGFYNWTGLGTQTATNSIDVQLDGKILVGGAFFSFNNINRSYIARIGGELAV